MSSRYLELFDVDRPHQTEAQKFSALTNDGENRDLHPEADVVVIAISGGGKTVLCAELARRGIKAANVPITLEGEMIHSCNVDLRQYVRLGAPLVVAIECTLPLLVSNRSSMSKNIGSALCENVMRTENQLANMFYKEINCPVVKVQAKNRQTGEKSIKTIMQMADEIADKILQPFTPSRPAKPRGYMLQAHMG